MSKPGTGPREIVLLPRCLDDLAHWVAHDRALALKTLALIEQTSRDPLGAPASPNC